MIVNLWRYRSFILRNAASDMRLRHAGPAVGVFWHVIYALVVRVLTADGRRVVQALGAACATGPS